MTASAMPVTAFFDSLLLQPYNGAYVKLSDYDGVDYVSFQKSGPGTFQPMFSITSARNRNNISSVFKEDEASKDGTCRLAKNGPNGESSTRADRFLVVVAGVGAGPAVRFI